MVETQGTISDGLRRWFRPPRKHGEVIEDRTVGFVELFYDLVFVVLIAQLAHTLAEHITWVGVRNFVVVFALIWIGWLNGTLYHDFHGGEDGRSRVYIFNQMSVLVVMAAFAAHAADDVNDGRSFAIGLTVFFIMIGWQWYDVRRFDSEEWRPVAGRYVTGLALVTVVVAATALIDNPDTRVLIWGGVVAATLIGNFVMARSSTSRHTAEMAEASRVTDSLAERFGLFTIIVLGEVVVGVATGLSDATHNFITIVTGLLAIQVGFGLWWSYFDFVGRRIPEAGYKHATWMWGHLPLAIGISATGAGMVSLIEHAQDGRTPSATAWLVAGGVATVALSIAGLSWTIPDHPSRRMVPYLLTAAAIGALILGALRPAPWLFVFVLGFLLSMAWIDAFVRHSRLGLPIAESTH